MTNLAEAIPLQVHRKTDCPPMTDQLKAVFAEILELRRSKGQQVRKAGRIRQHLDGLILDLYIAHQYSPVPWRAVSRNRNDYTKGTRYRKLFFRFDLLMGVLNDLVELELIEQKIGFHDRTTNKGYQTRIRASDKLLNLIESFDVKEIVRNPEAPEDETIIKKDASGKIVGYIDDRFTNEMREFLSAFNHKLRKTDINTDAIELRYSYDPTAITVKRIFHQDAGGRFYNGFWQNMPKVDRLKLLLEDAAVCELDYGAFHPTIAYAFNGIPVTEDPYTIDGCERSEVKKAFLVLFNCRDRQHAIYTIRSFGIKNVEQLLDRIEQKHEPIKAYFYNPGFGMTLQNTDSFIAERILKRLTEDGIVCLPIHDSFIVSEEHKEVLHEAMNDSFYEVFNVNPIIK